MPHPSEHRAAERPLDRDEAERVAETMRAFGSASRLRLLWALLEHERTVEQLVAAVGMEQSAVSHQLRLLRQQRLVSVRRDGRRAFYRLHDHHLPELLTAMRHHHEHVHPPTTIALPADMEAAHPS
ncbi:helix-turn-helix transcriptional regulator [Baekduia soli]|uniref:Helix-turn-helix transcriptional regulator n=2 Tax=Baekduia soli TaxID=496014 RepID=A0A5B8UC13_9ACTN|nr:helix-turn-helix transcriptional regulator [Baekduia soli]